MKYLLFFIFIAAIESYILPKNNTSCPANAKLGPDNRCYAIYGDDDACILSWNESRSYCKKKGGDLASISNAFVNAFLMNMFEDSRSQCDWGMKGAWIGLTIKLNANNTCEWIWSDGTPLSYINWAYGGVSPIPDYSCNKNLQIANPSGYMQGDGKWDFVKEGGPLAFYQILCVF